MHKVALVLAQATLLFLLSTTLGVTSAEAESQSLRPNIILVMTDDQGYGDLGCHGNPVLKTPAIDAFYGQAARFTEFHVSPTCAPTRAALLTGRHEFRSGVTHTIFERERLALTAVTLPQLLQTVGYRTGIFGKWHLGDEAAYQPDQRGFNECFIHGAGGIGQSYPGSCGDAPGNSYFNPMILHNRKFVKTQGYCTDVFFQQAISWIDQQRQAGQPFFAYITPNAPHAPLDCPPEYEARYAGLVPPATARFLGMISNIDDNFGRLLDKLKEWQLEQNTLVIFMTDNGGTQGVTLFNAGMRGGKVTPYRGGTRVPALWRWPQKWTGGRDLPQLTAHVDVLPTMAEITGFQIPAGHHVDGRSLLPLLTPSLPAGLQPEWPERTLVTHVGRWERGRAAEASTNQCSVRNTRFHLVNAHSGREAWELFDLQADPGEKHNVIDQFPEVAEKLRQELNGWWDEVFPLLVNENLDGPPVNPFRERYEQQFGQPADQPTPGQ